VNTDEITGTIGLSVNDTEAVPELATVSAARALIVFVPTLRGTVADQCAKLSLVVAVTPLTDTEATPDIASFAVPWTTTLVWAVLVPETGEVMETAGAVASIVVETVLLKAETLVPSVAVMRQ